MKQLVKNTRHAVLALTALAGLSGCAAYELNTGRGNIPGHWIRAEMQEADRAVEAARAAGKDKACPAEFRSVEAAREHAYNVFRACHTEEGAELAKNVTAKTGELCPAVPVAGVTQPASASAPKAVASASDTRDVPPPVAGKSRQNSMASAQANCSPLRFTISFATNKAIIKKQFLDDIKPVVDLLNKYPDATAAVEGHTDSRGPRSYNMKLSQDRARSVKSLLFKKFGIAAHRISVQGVGPDRPAADNTTAAGRQLNRRVDAVVICP